MAARQRSASSLSQSANAGSGSSSPGGFNSHPSRESMFRGETDPIMLSAAEIPSFHGGDVTPSSSYGDTFPAMTATYIPSGIGIPPNVVNRPRAHTNSSSDAALPSSYGALRHQPSRNSMLPMQPGMGMRHASTSALETVSRPKYPASGPSPQPRAVMPTAPSNLPAHALNQREYQPHYASRNEYQRPSTSQVYHPAPPPYTPSYNAQQRASQIAPLQTGGGAYTPPYNPSQYGVQKPQSEMYRMPQQSSESVVSRMENSDSDYSVSAQSAALSRGAQSSGTGPGIARSGYAQSPLATSQSALTVTPDVAGLWTLDRVANYLDRHNFSTEWQQAFRNLNVYGAEFLELGNNRGLMGLILPEVMRLSPQADESRERANASNIKKMIQDILRLAHSTEDSDPPSSGSGAGPHGAPAPLRLHQQQPAQHQPNQHQQGGQPQRRMPARSHTGDSNDGSSSHRPTPSDTSSIKGRYDFSRAALGSVDSGVVRQSPPTVDYNPNQGPHPVRPTMGSPHDSPSLIYGTRHNHSNSSESVVSVARNADGKPDHKALKVLGIKTGRDKDHSQHDKRSESGEKRGGGGIFDKMKDFIRPKGSDNYDEESPTSPGWRRDRGELPFVANNGSSSSIDRASMSSFDGFRRTQQQQQQQQRSQQRPLYVFATRDSKNWVSIEVTRVESAEDLRKEVCANVGIIDWMAALLYQTEVGQKAHEDCLKDITLWKLYQSKADSYASLKFFVRSSPSSAVDSPGLPQVSEEPENTPMLKTGSSQGQPRKGSVSNAPTLREVPSVEDLETKERVEALAEKSGVSPTAQTSGDLDDLLSRLETLKSQQETGNPDINVIPPPGFTSPDAQPPQNSAVQQPEGADQGYPSFTSTWEGDYSTTLKTAEPSPIDGPSPGTSRADADELFLPQSEEPPMGTLTRHRGRTASSGTHALEAARQNKVGQPPVSPSAGPGDKLRRRTSRTVDPRGFSKITPIQTHRVVDFDNPRASPYEDRRMDTMIPQPQLIPHREPPPPPNRTSSGSWNKLQAQRLNNWHEAGRGHAHMAQARQNSVDKPMMQIRDRSRGTSPAARVPTEGTGTASPGRGGIAAGLISAGVQVAGITGTPIPGTPGARMEVSQPGAMSSQPDLQVPPAGSGEKRSGSSPRNPRKSWVLSLFKPDCDPESEPPTVQKLKLQIPPRGPKQRSPEISPLPVDVTKLPEPVQRRQSVQFEENHVEFDNGGQAESAEQDNDDSDSDDGLFAIPIAARQEKPAVDIPKTIPEADKEETGDNLRPSLQVSTSVGRDSVRFRSPPTTSTTGSDSGNTAQTPPSPEYEEGDDRGGLNSPAVHAGRESQPTSALPQARSPADYSAPLYAGLGRRNSFIRDDVWASRPPAEALIDNLDEFFPNLDLDQPILEDTGSPPASPTAAEKPQSYQLSDPPMPSPISEIPEGNESTISEAPSTAPPPIPSNPKRTSIVAQRNINRSGLGRMKSIREVVKDTHKKRYTQAPGEDGTNNSMLLRRKSTKFFGARLIDMTPTDDGRGKRSSRATQRSMWSNAANTQASTSSASTPTSSAPGVQRQATFRWFKGQLIGKGTYGRVYLGMNATTGEFLAVKQVEVAPTMGDSERIKEMIAALNQEIETMQHLDHINIVQYLGCERKEYGMSIFLEYISGGSVGSCLRKHGRFEEPLVRSLTRQTLSGLQYLHSEGILHRDLKADNILLDIDGTCKISDFGISKKSDNIYGDDPGNSMQGSVFWMAPEVIRPEGQGYSAKIDIWSLGCVVLEMFAGRRPWSKEEAIGAIYKLGSERQAPPVPDDVSSVISPSAIGFLADCHTIDASERPTASTLLQEHEFCTPDPSFNFMETELYKKIKPLAS